MSLFESALGYWSPNIQGDAGFSPSYSVKFPMRWLSWLVPSPPTFMVEMSPMCLGERTAPHPQGRCGARTAPDSQWYLFPMAISPCPSLHPCTAPSALTLDACLLLASALQAPPRPLPRCFTEVEGEWAALGIRRTMTGLEQREPSLSDVKANLQDI